MVIVLVLLAVGAFLAGALFFAVAKSAIHEIEGLVCWLISAVCLSGGVIVEATHRMRRELLDAGRLPGRSGSGEHRPTFPTVDPDPPMLDYKRPLPLETLAPSSPGWEERPITALTPFEAEQADAYLATLATSGYRLQGKRRHVWELKAPTGGTHFIHSLDQLQRLAHTVADSNAPKEKPPPEATYY